MQTRTISCFPDKTGFAVGSIEGRCSIAYIEDVHKEKAFTFKCHRSNTEVFVVNVIEFHPTLGTLITCGSDGVIVFWDKESKIKIRAMNSCNYPVTAAKVSTQGDMLAYAVGYDWSKGYEVRVMAVNETREPLNPLFSFQNNAPNIPKKLYIHRISEADVKSSKAPGAGSTTTAQTALRPAATGGLFGRR